MSKLISPPAFRTAGLLSAVAALILAASPYYVNAQATTSSPSPATATPAPSAVVTPPQWDVVSVRPSSPQECTGNAGMRTTTDGVNIFCIPLLFTIEQAYQIREPNRILNAPEWVKGPGMWQIDAKVAGEDVAAFKKLNRDQHMRMLQPLLADRFHLKAHIEQREMPIYELVVAKGGSKLKEAAPNQAGGAHMIVDGSGKVDAANASLAGLPGLLNREVGRPVVDKTGLTGKYNFTLEYAAVSKAGTDDSAGPSIFTAVEEQLGLKLEPAKAPMDVLVIDSIEQPTAN